uniref:Reverse transcriptase domain-containing protein n=1 Tax=Nothobranchius furzeri TaxID=105023 RepID=A0A8C6M161_NOTFU
MTNELHIDTNIGCKDRFWDFDSNIDPDYNFFNNEIHECNYYNEEQFNIKMKSENSLTIAHFNSRSLYANFDAIKEYIAQFKKPFTVIAISETWITHKKEGNFELYGYDFIHQDRIRKKGGGVALYIDKNLNYKKVEMMTTTIEGVMECVTVEISMKKKTNILVSCIYRTPGSKIETFKNKMEEMFTNLYQKGVFICGDFNIDLLNPNKNKSTEEFIDIMYSLGLFPLITRPTRITLHCTTLIDNIFTNIMEEKVESGLLISDISDHLPVFASYDCHYKNETEGTNYMYKRMKTEQRLNSLKNDLLEQDWNIVYEKNEVDQAYDTFLNIFKSQFDRNCPVIKNIQRNKYKEKPWMTKGLQNACNKKNTLYREFIKNRTTEAEQKYKRYKNKLINIVRSCKREYFIKKLEHNRNNIKGIWKVLNGVIRKETGNNNYPQHFIERKNNITNMNEAVDEFNKYFVNIGSKLEEKIIVDEIQTDATEYVERNKKSVFLRAVDEKEIYEIVRNMKNKTSTDWNDIDMKTLKYVIEGIVKPLTHICNLSFQKGFFPNNMKVARVIPIYKTGDKHQFTNYRPVSILSQFSKILEKLFVKRFDNFVDQCELLTECQYGFRNNRSTVQALIDLNEEITECIDKKKHAIGLFLDLKKAFDTVNHDVLMRKMEKYGFRGIVLDWIKSYLSNRQQYVQINQHKSGLREIQCGVPQGSVLGPKLFIMYINDICRVSQVLKFVLFADDTNVFCSGVELQQVLDVVTQEINKLKKWFDVNKLSLNLEKTKFMLFGNESRYNELDIVINNVKIERVYEIKFLGVVIDSRICWKPHIKYVRGKLARGIAILGKAKYIFNQKALYILYNTMLLPYLSYCVEVWGNTYKSNLQTITTMQKRAIRLITNAGYLDHTNELFIKTRTMKFQDLVKYKTAQIMYKVRNKLMPDKIQKLFTEREGGYNLRGTLNLKIHKFRTTLKQMCITIIGVKLWNNLEEEIKVSTNINVFKMNYKKHILNKYIVENR